MSDDSDNTVLWIALIGAAIWFLSRQSSMAAGAPIATTSLPALPRASGGGASSNPATLTTPISNPTPAPVAIEPDFGVTDPSAGWDD